MASMYYPLLALSSCLLASTVHAEVTVYGLLGQTTAAPVQTGAATSTTPTTTFYTDHGPPRYTELAAYNPVYLEPPVIPNPPPRTSSRSASLPTGICCLGCLSSRRGSSSVSPSKCPLRISSVSHSVLALRSRSVQCGKRVCRLWVLIGPKIRCGTALF
ncbi:hypothetical protein C8Q80DRAFT_945234 [Daedaleopsis nitida]|nr:hypothetical protein C8Q80DRAFT_945234 [Daedaleopsis nitida]